MGSSSVSSRRFLITLLLVGLATSVSAQTTHNVADCERSTLANKLAEGGVVDGDTINVTAGGTCDYTSQLTITKAVSLTGAGSGAGGSVIRHVSSHLAGPFTYSAAIKYDLTANSYDGFVEITGFHFTRSCTGGCDNSNDQIFDGFLEIRSFQCQWNNLRVHHNKFTMVLRDHGMGMQSSCIGALIDNNEFVGDGNGIKLYGSGDDDWSSPLSFGVTTSAFTFVENNTFSMPNDCGTRAWGDLHTGGRVVFRRNTLTNAFFQTHDQVLSGSPSGQAWELYENIITSQCTSQNLDHGLRLLGGTGIAFRNHITGEWGGGVGVYNQASANHRNPGFGSAPPGGLCDGDDPIDNNTLGTGWICRYQIGSLGLTTSAVSAPAIFFLNTCDSGVDDCVSSVADANPVGFATDTHLVVNRDYINRNASTCAPGGGTCVGGGVGLFTQRPSACTSPAFWWSTDQGEWDAEDGEGTIWEHDSGSGGANGADGKMSFCISNAWDDTQYGPNNTSNNTGTPATYPRDLGGSAPPNTTPSISISSPAVNFWTQLTTVTLTGTCTDNDLSSGAVTWSNALTGGSGTASGVASWTISSAALNAGVNTFTVTCSDGSLSAQATLAILRESCGASLPYTQNYSLSGTAANFGRIPCFSHYGSGADYTIASNQGTITESGTFDVEVFTGQSVLTDHYIKATITDVNPYPNEPTKQMRLCVRATGADGSNGNLNAIWAQIDGHQSSNNFLGRYVNGSFDTILQSFGTVNFTVGTSTLKIEAIGSEVKVYVDIDGPGGTAEAQIGTTYTIPSGFTTGLPGLCPTGAGTDWDGVEVGNATAPGDTEKPVIDLDNPTGTYVPVANSITQIDAGNINGSVTDNIAVTSCTVDSDRVAGGPVDMTLVAPDFESADAIALSVGINIITVRCADAAGNFDTETLTYERFAATPQQGKARIRILAGLLKRWLFGGSESTASHTNGAAFSGVTRWR